MPETHGSTTRTWAWVSAIGAGVFLGTGAVAYGVGSGALSTWNSASCLSATMPMLTRAQQCPGQQSTIGAMQVLEPVGFIGGGLLAVTATVLFVASSGSHGGEHASARFGCGSGPGTVGMMCGGSF